MNLSVVISLCGGLGLFLYGMKVMSKAIETVAGAKLRHFLEIFTTNRFTGMIVGLIFTAAIQSSSACTAMVVSFVNAGLMDLFQAAGVIFGANIGTTVTSQLVSFNISKYAPIILLAGVVCVMFAKKQKVKDSGEIIVGFGILFMGLQTMSSSMSSLKTDPAVANLLLSIDSPILATIVGMLITTIVQSSSVTVSIVLLMAQQDLLTLPMCLYIIMGCNIGACTTALIASLPGKKDAKRAAMIHLWFNIIGTALMYVVLAVAMDPVIRFIQLFSADNGRFVANAHTLIKVAQVIVLLPFIKPIVKLSIASVRGEDRKIGYRESFQLKYIGSKVIFNPATAMIEVVKELDRMASLASENLNRAMNALVTLDEDDIEEVYKVEENINFLNHAITGYLVQINQLPLPIEDLKSIGAMFHVVNDIERIGDHAENAADAARTRKENGAVLSHDALRELGEMMDMVNTIIGYSMDIFAKSDETHLQDVIELEDKIDLEERRLQENHVKRLAAGECTPEAGMIFSDIVSGLERVADHATNIAFAIKEEEDNLNAAKQGALPIKEAKQ